MVDALALVDPRRLTKRRILIVLVVGGVLLGAGVGVLNSVDQPPAENRTNGIGSTATPPRPPDVNTTPPTATVGEDGGRETPSETAKPDPTLTPNTDGGEGTPTETATPSPSSTPTATEAPTDSNTGSDSGGSSGGGTGSTDESTDGDESGDGTDDDDTVDDVPPPTQTERTSTQTERTSTQTDPSTATPRSNEGVGSLTLTASDPADAVSMDGDVDVVEGTVTGTLSWGTEATTAVVVVHTWVPTGDGSSTDNWKAVRTVTITLDDGSRSLREILGAEDLVYAVGARADRFNNTVDGTTVQRTGYVNVTVDLYDGSEQIGRVTATDSYQFSVTNLAEMELDLEESDGTGMNVTDAVPGDRGTHELSVANVGEENGTLSVALTNLTSTENGLTRAEPTSDTSETGELEDVLELRIAVVVDGERRYLVGGPSEWVNLTTLIAEGGIGSVDLPANTSRTLVVDWRIPTSAGNAIQSDGVGFDVTVTLRADDT